MNRIFNWTFGSLFRTFGRVLAYLILGLVFGYFISHSSLKMPKISDLLGIAVVKADTFDSVWLGELYQDESLSTQYSFINPSGSPAFMGFTTGSIYGGYFNKTFYHTTRSISGANYIEYSYFFNNQSSVSTADGPQFSILAYVISPNQGTLWCENVAVNTNSKYGKIKCPVKSTTTQIKGINVYIIMNNNEATTLTFGLQASATLQKPSSNDSVTSAIENEIQQNEQNAQEIISSQNQTTTEIINNQNQNTQQQIESQQVCTIYNKNNIKEDNSYLGANGRLNSNNNYGLTDYINITPNTKIKVLKGFTGNASTCFYTTDKNLISCIQNGDLIENDYLTIPSNAYNVRFSIFKSEDKPQFEICKNGNQAMSDAITDDSSPDIDSLSPDTMAGWLPPGPVDSILNLPLTLLNSLNNAMGNQCTAVTLPLPFVERDLTLPCLNSLLVAMGFSSFWGWVGTIASAFILFSYLTKLYKWVDDTLTFRENNHIDNWGGV